MKRMSKAATASGVRPQVEVHAAPVRDASVAAAGQARRVLLVVGTGPRVAADVSAARSILDGTPTDVMVVNFAGAVYTDRIKFLATWHPEEVPALRQRRLLAGGNDDYEVVSQFDHVESFGGRCVPVRISGGSSGLYAALAGLALGYDRVVVAGVDLQGEGYQQFQRGWLFSYEVIKDTVRAVSGYPKELLGPPSPEWLAGSHS